MTLTIKKIALPELHPTLDETRVIANPLSLVGGVEMTCWVRIGTVSMTITELGQLKQGQIISLDQHLHEPVDIMVNQHVIARGKLMCCDDYFAVKIMDVG